MLNVDSSLRARWPDVHFIDCGLVHLPGVCDAGTYAGPRPGIVYACVAETILWALERQFGCVAPETGMAPNVIGDLARIGDAPGLRVTASGLAV